MNLARYPHLCIHHQKNIMRRCSGFSLIEILMALTIVAILATIAVPSYNNAIAKAERAEAYADLNKIAQAQERYFTVNRRYTADFGALNMAAAGTTPLTSSKGTSDYTIVFISGNDQTFTITATPAGTARNIWTMTLNHQGVKGSIPPHPSGSWPE